MIRAALGAVLLVAALGFGFVWGAINHLGQEWPI